MPTDIDNGTDIAVRTSTQTAIPCYFMRGGTSRGPFFLESDLPADSATRDRVLLAILGSPDPRQIDGLGGAHPLTSKVGIVRKSTIPGVDLDFLFAQIQPNKSTVDTTPNCGNMLAAVVPFALERGLVQPQDKLPQSATTLRVRTLNTDMQCDITVPTQYGQVQYAGSAKIDGVPGSAAPVLINFLDTAGSVCHSLLPTGNIRDTVSFCFAPSPEDAESMTSQTLDVTCIDNGMPLVLLRASDVGCTGRESVAELNANTALKIKLEALRIHTAQLMGLGDVTEKNYPKMTLIAPPYHGGCITSRSFIPHVCHDAIGVLAAVTVATACILEGSVAHDLAILPAQKISADALNSSISVEHPTGEFSVELGVNPAQPSQVVRAALLRTSRLLMRGEVMIPATLWQPSTPIKTV